MTDAEKRLMDRRWVNVREREYSDAWQLYNAEDGMGAERLQQHAYLLHSTLCLFSEARGCQGCREGER